MSRVSHVDGKDIFILDSGATLTVIKNKLFIKSYREFTEARYISTAGGQKLRIYGSGLMDGIGEVFYVPDAKRNLISISQLTKSGSTITFTNNKVLINNNEIGFLDNKLYILKKRPEDEALNTEDFADDGHSERLYSEAENEELIGKETLKIELLHKRFAHTNVADIKELIRCGACDGFDNITHQQSSPSHFHCEACAMAKATTKSRDPTKKLRRNLTAVNKDLYFHVVYSDLIGPMQVRSVAGHYYGITFTEMTSRYRYFYPLKHKSDALTAFKMLNAEVESQGFKIKMLKSDNGGEYVSAAFAAYCVEEKILQRFTSPHTPSSNSISERFNRVLGEKSRSMLYGANLPLSLWAECMKTATYVANRLISPTHRSKTPYELLYGIKPDVSNLRAFGCTAYFFNFDVDRKKLDNKAMKGALVGYDLQSSSYLIYCSEKHTVRRTGHVVFNEHKLYYTHRPKESATVPDQLDEHQMLREQAKIVGAAAAAHPETSESSIRKSDRVRQPIDRLAFLADECVYSVEELVENVDYDFDDYCDPDDAPTKFDNIKNRADSRLWFDSVIEENSSLDHHSVFEVVSELPRGKNIIKARYIFKRKVDGRYKARLVAKGYSQIKGIDYNEVFAPVVGKINLRMLLSLAAAEDWNIYQMDVKTAFLHGALDEDIYMEATAGMPYPKGTILKLKKSLYGLKQAPRQWNKSLDAFILSQGFKRCHIDRSVYIRGSGSTATIIAVYVDDILIFGHDHELITKFKTDLNAKFQIEDLGQVKNILGMEVERDREHRTLKLSQCKYIAKLIAKFRMDKAKDDLRPVPLSKATYNSVIDGSHASAQSTSHPYRSALGGILYANVCCRPDISFAVSTLASHSVDPKGLHWKAMMDLLRYIKSTQDLAITYGRMGSASEFKNSVYIYADADYARDLKRKSRSGYVIYLNGGPIAWNSSLQSRVANSTSEAELYAMHAAVQQAYSIRELLGELGFPQDSLKCYEDNTGCIDWIVNQRASSRMKAIEVKYYWLRDTKDNQECEYIHVDTKLQKADMFTKQMDYTIFNDQVVLLYNLR